VGGGEVKQVEIMLTHDDQPGYEGWGIIITPLDEEGEPEEEDYEVVGPYDIGFQTVDEALTFVQKWCKGRGFTYMHPLITFRVWKKT
jgi:hypothetical protein